MGMLGHAGCNDPPVKMRMDDNHITYSMGMWKEGNINVIECKQQNQ